MKGLIIFNPKSGKRKKGLEVRQLKASLEHFFESLDIFEIKSIAAFKHELSDVLGLVDIVFVAGGDGTVHTVVNLMMHLNLTTMPAIFPLPFGTSNDIAHIFGNTKNAEDILYTLTQNSYEVMDLIKVNDHYAVYAIASGKYTNVSYGPSRKLIRILGVMAYWGYLLVDMFKRYQQKTIITYEGKVIETKSFLLMGIVSSRMAGFNLNKFPNKVLLNDGMIDLVSFKPRFLASMSAAEFYLKNGFVGEKNLIVSTNELHIKMTKPWIWNLDGERAMRGDVHIKVLPKVMRIYGKKACLDTLFKKGVI